jgi:hypothetical protein
MHYKNAEFINLPEDVKKEALKSQIDSINQPPKAQD